jgi:hypothetical protein
MPSPVTKLLYKFYEGFVNCVLQYEGSAES